MKLRENIMHLLSVCIGRMHKRQNQRGISIYTHVYHLQRKLIEINFIAKELKDSCEFVRIT